MQSTTAILCVEKVEPFLPPLLINPPGNTSWERISWARLTKRLTQKEVSIATKLSLNTIVRSEKVNSSIELTTIRLLANVLEQQISYLGCFEILPENTLGQRIKKARLYHGLLKSEFAEKIGVNVRTIRFWELDKHKLSDESIKLVSPFLEILD